MLIAIEVIGRNYIGMLLGYQLKTLLKATGRQPDRADAEVFRFLDQVMVLNRAFKNRYTLAVQVKKGVDVMSAGLIELRLAVKGWNLVEVHRLRPIFAEGDIRHDVEFAVAEQVQAVLPGTRHRDQRPLFLCGDCAQQIAKNSG